MLQNLIKTHLSVGSSNESARMAWVQTALSRVPPGSRILDAGAGERRYKRYCRHLQYVSQDFAQYDGAGDGVGLQTTAWDNSGLDIVCDICSIPEADQSFDAILCTEVIEHIPDPLRALKEFVRLLRPGGFLILTAPFCSITHFSPYHFSTGFSRYYYEHHLPVLGLKIEELAANGSYFQYLAQELKRLPTINKKHAGGKNNLVLTILSLGMLLILQRAARRDRGSEDLLNYGFHVMARKL